MNKFGSKAGNTLEGVLLIMLMIICLVCVVQSVWYSTLNSEAIQNNVAWYNPTNGNWEWHIVQVSTNK
jgi:hypothetical protein